MLTSFEPELSPHATATSLLSSSSSSSSPVTAAATAESDLDGVGGGVGATGIGVSHVDDEALFRSLSSAVDKIVKDTLREDEPAFLQCPPFEEEARQVAEQEEKAAIRRMQEQL